MNETSNYNEVMRIGVRTPNLTRRSCFKRITLAAGVILLLTFLDASGEDAPGRVPPKGLRVLYSGASWHNFVPKLVEPLTKAAGIQGHENVGNLPYPKSVPVLEKGGVDAYSWGYGWWNGDLLPDVEAVTGLGLKQNPEFRTYVQTAWLVNDGHGYIFKDARKFTKIEDYDDSKIADVQAAVDKMQRVIEAWADRINEKQGKRVIFLVPVGYAVVKLRALVVDGKFPKVSRQSELFRDTQPHPGNLIMALQTYCHFSALYRMPPPDAVPPPDGADQAQKDDYAQQVILRNIAWETVSGYPYAGVAPK